MYMQKVLYQGSAWKVETTCGTEFVEEDICSRNQVSAYVEGKILEPAKKVSGWIVYLSAPGYMDRTETTVYPSKEKAEEYLKELSGEDEI